MDGGQWASLTAQDDVQSPQEAGEYLGDGVHVFLVKSLDGEYFAGFTRGLLIPSSWPRGEGLESLFRTDSIGGLLPVSKLLYLNLPSIPDAVYRILEAWKRQPNVLLYGPSGTGKTHAISVLWQLLELWDGLPVLMLETEDRV